MDIGDAVAWYIAFVLSATAHEASHALAAYLGGDPTAYKGGQVSLNPLPHIQREPIGMVVVPILAALWTGSSLGWASTPYDPLWEQRHPRRAAWMAAAGPAANLLIAALCLGALKLGLEVGTFAPPERVAASFLVTAATPLAENMGRFLGILLVLNSILFAVNLLPFPPLDGASVLGLLLSDENALRLKETLASDGLGSILFLVVMLFFGPLLMTPIWKLVLSLVHPGLYG